jgi:predicted nucleotidyltransferase
VAPSSSVRGQLGARGVCASTDGDIDFLVDLEPGRTLLDIAGFRREAEAILGTSVVVATPDMLKERIRAEAEAEALPL